MLSPLKPVLGAAQPKLNVRKTLDTSVIFFSLVPPFVLLIGWLALAEPPSLFQLIGLAIVLFGFPLTQKDVKIDPATRVGQIQGPGP